MLISIYIFIIVLNSIVVYYVFLKKETSSVISLASKNIVDNSLNKKIEENVMVNFCPDCGSNQKGNNFCTNCGLSLKK